MKNSNDIKPVSKTPTIMLLSPFNLLFAVAGKPINSHDLVVCSFLYLFGMTEATSSMPREEELNF